MFVPVAVAHDPVAGTVYDGQFPASQANGNWSDVPVQFVVSSNGRVVSDIADAVAVCAPPPSVKIDAAVVHHGEFESHTDLSDYHVTISGRFESGGRASGTGVLFTSDVTGQPCRIEGHWTASALPAGTRLCPSIPTHTVTSVTVTGMTCAEAAAAYQAGIDMASAVPNPTGLETFQTPGFTCAQQGDPTVKTLCRAGKRIFRLPA
jgi:hypothetical protein